MVCLSLRVIVKILPSRLAVDSAWLLLIALCGEGSIALQTDGARCSLTLIWTDEEDVYRQAPPWGFLVVWGIKTYFMLLLLRNWLDCGRCLYMKCLGNVCESLVHSSERVKHMTDVSVFVISRLSLAACLCDWSAASREERVGSVSFITPTSITSTYTGMQTRPAINTQK